jgi:hypothetical protein
LLKDPTFNAEPLRSQRTVRKVCGLCARSVIVVFRIRPKMPGISSSSCFRVFMAQVIFEEEYCLLRALVSGSLEDERFE